MTPDSPKGPESEALRERVAEHFRVQWGYAQTSEWLKRCAGDAVDALSPELERITFERDAAQATADNIAQQLEDLRDDVLGDDSLHVLEVASAAGRELERLTAELERRTSQAQLMAASSERFFRACKAKVAELERVQAQYDQAVEDWGRNDEQMLAENQRLAEEVSRLREQLDSATELVDHLLLLFATGEKGHPGRPCVRTGWIDETAVARFRERRAGLGVSSSEVEAPQPQEVPTGAAGHVVAIDQEWTGVYIAKCMVRGCEQNSGSGTAEHAQFWKDQHEADTLVPQLQANSKLEQNLEDGRPSGSERLAPRPVQTGLVLVSRAELVSGMLVGISGEHDPVPTQQQLDRAADLIIRAARRRDRTQEGQARLLAVLFDHQCAETGCTDKAVDGEVMCSQHLVPDESGQDAAQAARSAATPKVWRDIRGCEWEEDAPHDELRLIRTEPSHCREVNGPTFSRRYVQAHYGPLAEVPSPPLRKEGEDTPSPSVSTQEETKGETDE